MAVNPIYHHTNEKLAEEARWIEKAKKDTKSFEPLYSKYYEQIFRYVYQRMDSEDQAHDVTSQVFLKAIKNLPKYEFRGVPFASWLYRIAKSELYQAYRDNKAKRTVNIDSYQLHDFIEEFESADNESNKKKLIQMIAKLNENEVQLIELRYFEKRSFKEMGEILEIKENNAKVKTFRVVQKLKKLFTE
jgi:RNA polymerase sigma-70 factor (ECF subfamily)